MAVGMSFVTAPAQAAYELPEGERITHVGAVARSIPQKEEYELYDPKIGKNFDLNKFWMRGDLRVRPIMRNGVCFGSAFTPGTTRGSCNSPNPGTTPNGTPGKQNDFYAQQLTRLGFGYDLSPDVNFYMELQDSRTWGGNGANGLEGTQDDARNHNGCATANGGGNCGTLGVRAGYMLIRNFAGLQGLSVKAGRQYVVLGNQSLFGAFDWSNTGISHDGVMLQYSTKAWDIYGGWFRTSESDLGQAVPVGAQGPNIGPSTVNNGNANQDSDVFMFYNQIKSVPGFIIEPYYFLYSNRYNSQDNRSMGLGTPRHSNQTRHSVGGRIEMRKGNFDAMKRNALPVWPNGRHRWAQWRRLWKPKVPPHQRLGDQKLDRVYALRVGLETAVGLQLRLCLGRWPGELYLTGIHDQVVKLPIRLRTCTRPTTCTWASWTCKAGRTCGCPR